MYEGTGIPLREIARVYGVSHERIRQIIDKGRGLKEK